MHRAARSRFISARGLRHHVREWGPEQASPADTVWMLHGWMDVSASFQFVVDAMQPRWRVLAPDWRGFGLTDRALGDCYWFVDYLADFEALATQLTPSAPMQIVGHSMGGNVAMLYAGVRPDRVGALVNLEGVGLRAARPDEAPRRLARWLDQIADGARLRDYASLDEVAARLQSNNPRLSSQRAAFLAEHWAQRGGDGRFHVAGDPAHRIVNPTLYRLDEMLEAWRRIACAVLWVIGEHSEVTKHIDADPAEARREIERRRAVLKRCESAIVRDAGHMLHHDQPRAVAALIEEFLQRQATS